MTFGKRKIYMDNASATVMDKRVLHAMLPYLTNIFSNPNSIHKSAVLARKAIDQARSKIAKLIFAHPDEIIFTGSGTESDALAILGIITNNSEVRLPHIVTTNIEHSAVLENCKMLERDGKAEVTYVEVESNGIVDPKKVRDAIKDNTVLVSIMYANNEIGTVQPIQEIAKVIRAFRKDKQSEAPFFHTDACQAMNYLDTANVDRLGVDMMSFNGSKNYGPKGVGVLYKKRGIHISPIYAGGGQEFGIRSGTENVAGIVGIAKALEITEEIKIKEITRLTKLRDYFFEQLVNLENKTGYKININGDRVARLPNNINISIDGISHELLVIELDAKGVELSNKSACHTEDEEHSHVISAIRSVEGDKFTQESLRFSLGRNTTKSDITKTIKILESILNKYKNWR
jgi:cysteine desulfurase